ncbi:MAG: anthranilate synthase component I family protein [Flavipsychrobacter sp.]|nr:anthranilate synthase component I family protein [Flavipsychrobacter sp.]
MQRQVAIFDIAPGRYEILKNEMLNWAQQFSIFLFLDSNSYQDKYSRYECLLGIGAHEHVAFTSLDAVQMWHDTHKDWLFGHIAYDYKNELENRLSSAHKERIGFEPLCFFQPEIVCTVNAEKTKLTIESLGITPLEVYKSFLFAMPEMQGELPELKFTQRISKEQYLNTIDALRRHIGDGDCYEINFCNEGFVNGTDAEPLQIFQALNKISPAPFAAFYRNDESFMMCASPERYLRKEGSVVMSQPIKGTAKRGADTEQDEAMKQSLHNSIKDRAENVMIVDLVRNDLSRSCETGSVQVDELFGIYTFPQVHQMISTVSAALRTGMPFTDAIRYSFPMGSMTGAPKIKVMQLIEQYEQSRRELFSGTVGYITPDADFDFNVIIRSLFYNADTKYLAYQTGGAITYDSTPEQEWEEMRLKAWALERIFS